MADIPYSRSLLGARSSSASSERATAWAYPHTYFWSRQHAAGSRASFTVVSRLNPNSPSADRHFQPWL